MNILDCMSDKIVSLPHVVVCTLLNRNDIDMSGVNLSPSFHDVEGPCKCLWHKVFYMNHSTIYIWMKCSLISTTHLFNCIIVPSYHIYLSIVLVAIVDCFRHVIEQLWYGWVLLHMRRFFLFMKKYTRLSICKVKDKTSIF